MKKTKEISDYLKLAQKLRVLNYAKERGKNKEAYELFGIKKGAFYKWKKKYSQLGEKGLESKKPIAFNFPNQIKPDVIQKVLELRKQHKLGTWRIKWYLERYHDIHVSESSVYRILKRNNVENLTGRQPAELCTPKDMRKRCQVIRSRWTLSFCSLKQRMDVG